MTNMRFAVHKHSGYLLADLCLDYLLDSARLREVNLAANLTPTVKFLDS